MNLLHRPVRRLAVGLLVLLGAAGVAQPDETPSRPNILLLVADDQSWNGLSVPMHPELDHARNRRVETPSLDTLASQGMRFSAAYSPGPVCAPSRIALQTGRSPAVLHWTRAGPSVGSEYGYKLTGPTNIRALSEKETTVGEVLKAAGYATAHFGKWHLKGGGPGAHGYDEHDGDIGNEYASRFKDPNPVDIFGMTERAIAFMKKSSAAKTPFFVQMSWHALHAPENALEATKEKYRKLVPGANDRRVGRMALAEDLDTGVGRLLTVLDDLGLTNTTYVIYTSDNGGSGGGQNRGKGTRKRARPVSGLKGGKGSLHEGGIRVPFIVRGPGVEADSWCHTPITGLDFLPTFAAWAGVRKLPSSLEGGSLTALLANKGEGQVTRSREGLAFHFPHYVGLGGPQSAYRLGSFKIIRFYEDDRVSLFDLAKDPGEQNDLSQEQPDRVATMKARLESYLKDVKAQMPAANPEYDPDKPPKPLPRGGGGKGR